MVSALDTEQEVIVSKTTVTGRNIKREKMLYEWLASWIVIVNISSANNNIIMYQLMYINPGICDYLIGKLSLLSTVRIGGKVPNLSEA